ncbi:MAG: methyltransferase domain-containing protein, partial [Gordonia sp. (in: high G+C Gram-positive bacteria)]
MDTDLRHDAQAFYTEAYRSGFVPWEAAGEAGAEQTERDFEREESTHPPGRRRALDIGCGRGRHAVELAQRGWEVIGVDFVAAAIDDARARAAGAAATFVVGDATDLEAVVS